MVDNIRGNGRHVEIAGAGFAGLTAAAALAQRGWSVRVHEKGSELREQGAGIVLWNNSLRVFEALGATEAIMENSMTPPFYQTRFQGDSRSREDFGGLPWRTMTRPHLYKVLLDAAISAGAEVLTDSAVEAADPTGSLTLASGEILHADLIIGADGVKSKVRDSIGFEQTRTKSKDGITRFLVPRCKAELGDGEWDNVIDFWMTEPRYLRVLYVPCNDEELYIALGAPRADEQGSRTPIDLDLWASAYPELKPVLEAAAVAEDPKYYGYETTHLKNWTAGKVAVVGDAAHAMCPALAQGAGTAIMNAYTLATAVTGSGSKPIEDVLKEWETLERPYTDRVQQRSADYAANRGMAEGNQFTDENLETAKYDPTDPDRHKFAEEMIS